MSTDEAQLLLCDSIAWRADLFEPALLRLRVSLAARSPALELTLGYRLSDDLALLVVRGPQAPAASELVAWTRLPGLRALEVPQDGPKAADIAERALATCDLVTKVEEGTSAAAQLRRVLGLEDDRRAALRVGLRLRVRYEHGGSWHEAQTRDVTGGGAFVATDGPRPEIGANAAIELELPGEGKPVRGTVLVVRHADGGFGCRLTVREDDDTRFQRAVARVRAVPLPDRRRKEPRVAAKLGVRFASGHAFAHAWAENISRGGLFVRTDEPPARGSRVELVLELPGEDEVPLTAEVVHVLDGRGTPGASGCGLAFAEMPAEVRERIESYVEAALAKPRARVLVAFPSPGRRAEMRSAFAALRCEVFEADSASAAFATLLEELLALDAFVIGDWLADGPSLPLLARVRRTGGERELPIMVCLDTAAPDERARFHEAGASVLFPRGTPAPFLAARVVRYVEERRGK